MVAKLGISILQSLQLPQPGDPDGLQFARQGNAHAGQQPDALRRQQGCGFLAINH
jgi:hypothetical protein